MEYKGIDVSFDPDEDHTVLAGDFETSARRTERVDLVWKDLSFTVPVKASRQKKRTDHLEDEKDAKPAEPVARQKQILRGISGYARAGTMLAVMGSSGAGKTSLLNLLAGRITTSKGATATGEVFVNGEPRDYQKFRKLAAYVLQDDDMFAELTVEEQLKYAALLRLPASMPLEKKLFRVQKVIQELGLGKIKNTMVGSQIVRGISGGERKRVNIGAELVTDPALLFLDEPTTGLDSFNALNVMTSLRHLASNGRTVISTIHQPRSSIFALFDQLCLLSEGRVMYFGPANDAVPYFAALSFRSPAQFNPADFFLDLLSIDPRSADLELNTYARVDFLANKFEGQQEPIAIGSAASQRDMEAALNGNDDHVEVVLKDRNFQTSWWNEITVLCTRALKLAVRERAANIARLGQMLIFSVILGLIWLQNGQANADSDRGLAERLSLQGVIFFIIINQAFAGVFSVIFGFPLERSVVTRERASNTYRTSSYFLSKTITDFPKTLFFNLVFSLIVYFIVGFKRSAGAFFIFLLFVFLASSIAESLAIAISILTGDVQSAAGVVPVFIILAVLFGGFFIGDSALPAWIGWGKWLSFVFYSFNGLVKNEFEQDEMLWPTLRNQFNELSIWENAAALIGITLLFRLMGYLFLQYLRGPKFLKF